MAGLYYLIAACAALLGQLCHGQTSSGPRKEIGAILGDIRQLIKERKDFSSHYTSDGVILPPGESPIFGRGAIRKSLKVMFDHDGMNDFVFEEPEVQLLADGKTAYSWQKFNLFNREGKVYYQGKSLVVWKRDDVTDKWLMAIEIFNDGR